MDNLDVCVHDLDGVDLTCVCDDYCKFPTLVRSQDELDNICDSCPYYKLLRLLDEIGITRGIDYE